MSYTTRKCYIKEEDYDSSEEYREELNKYMEYIKSLGYTILSYPDSSGYFHIEKDTP